MIEIGLREERKERGREREPWAIGGGEGVSGKLSCFNIKDNPSQDPARERKKTKNTSHWAGRRCTSSPALPV